MGFILHDKIVGFKEFIDVPKTEFIDVPKTYWTGPTTRPVSFDILFIFFISYKAGKVMSLRFMITIGKKKKNTPRTYFYKVKRKETK